jgi:hypothetical protein
MRSPPPTRSQTSGAVKPASDCATRIGPDPSSEWGRGAALIASTTVVGVLRDPRVVVVTGKIRRDADVAARLEQRNDAVASTSLPSRHRGSTRR